MAYEVLNRKKGSEKQHPNSISLLMNIFITVDLIVEKNAAFSNFGINL